jgi:hypothetical protein
MMVFVNLSRNAYERFWLPNLYKAQGRDMSVAFEKSEREIQAIADKVMRPPEKAKVMGLVERWKLENPNQVRVEWVRLGEFSKVAGQIAKARAEEARGLLSSISSGIQKADQALLMGDRAIFLAQRMPFLLRLHASLGVSEVLAAASAELDPESDLGAALSSSRALAMTAGQAAREARLLAQSLYPLILPKTYQMSKYLASANSLAEKSITLVKDLNSVSPSAVQRIEGMMTRLFLYLFALGSSIVVVWWAGYFWVKRRLLSARPADSQSSQSGRRNAA